MKKLLSVLLATMMLLTCIPLSAVSADGDVVFSADFNDGELKFDKGEIAEGPDGTNCLKWSATGAWSSTYMVVKGMDPAKDYTVTMKAKASVAGNMGVTIQNGDWGSYWNAPAFAVTTSWQDVVYTIPANSIPFTAGDILFKWQDVGVAMDLYIDDLVISEGLPATPDTPVNPDTPAVSGTIVNGDFETGDLTGWENVWGSCQTSIVDGRNGGSALSFTTPGSYQIVRQKVTVEANTDYVITLWAKDVKDMSLLVKNGADTHNVAQNTVNGGADWTATTLEFNSGDLTEVYVCVMGNVGGAKITCDDISMNVKGDEPEVPDTPDVPVAPGEGLTNGDFETGNASGWETWQSTAISADAAHSGSYGAHLKGSGSWGGLLNQTVAVEAGKNYEISLWAKVNASGVNLQIKDGNNDGAELDGAWLSAGAWTQFKFIVSSATGALYINFCGSGSSPEDAYVDDITIAELKDASFDGYITNGDFETGKTDSWESVWNGAQLSIVEGHNGGSAMNVSCTAAWQLTRQKVAVKPNTNYVLSVYAKNASGMALIVKSYPADQNMAQIGVGESDDWKKTSLNFNSGDCTEVYIAVMSNAAGDGGIFDDFSMFEKKDPSNDGYLINGTFETGDVAPWENLWGSCPKAEVVAGGKDDNYALDVISGEWKHVRQTGIAVEANTTYKVTLWAKNVNNMSLLIKDGGDSQDIANAGINGGEDWTENVVEFNTGANTTIIVSLMGSAADAYGTIDNVVMEKLPGCQHTYKTETVKATTTANGYTVKRCSVCKAETGKKTLYKVTSFTLSKTSYTYNGKVQKPTVTVKNSAGTKLTEGTSYTVSYASGLKNAGTYKVTITLKGNYSGTKTLTYKINPANVSTCKVTLSKTSYTYNGKVQKPTVTVKNAAGTKLSTASYTVTYASGLKAAGTYKVTVKMKGNYTGTKTLTYKINPINVSKCKITLSATSYTYDGKVKKPTVTVKNASGTKLSTASYTVTYASGRKNVGTYKVTVKMKGNYTGTKTLTFKINPAKTTLSSLTAGTKKLTVKWTKKTTQVTGYEIQYSTSKTFKSVKTKTITKNSTTSTALTGLKAKTTYYVRVRTYKTVNGVKYYSGWTTVKYKKTK